MLTVRRELGVLGVERSAHFAYLRWQPAATFRPLPHKIDNWKGAIHVVRKESLAPALRAKLNLFLPEERTPPEHALDRRMLQSTPLVVVSDGVRAELLLHGVRVWTVGYHRVPDLLRISATGGDGVPLWIEQRRERFFAQIPDAVDGALRPSGRPADVAWHGMYLDEDLIDRILRAVSGGVLDQASILLAMAIQQDGWIDLSLPPQERAHTQEGIDLVRKDLQQAEALCYADLQWSRARYFGDQPLPRPDPEHGAAVAALAADAGPAEIECAGAGRFFRELLPPATLHLDRPRHDPGWLVGLDAVEGSETPDRVVLPAVPRYVRAMKPGPWWEI